MIYRLIVLIIKELIQFFRDKGLLLFVFYLFTGDLYIAARGIDLTLKNAKFYVIDEDMSYLSRELVSKFQKPTFEFMGYISGLKTAEKYMFEDKCVGIITIPKDFEKKILSKSENYVGIIVNGTESSSSYLFAGYAASIISKFSLENSFKINVQKLPIVNLKQRVLYNQNMDSHIFMTITELFSVITLLILILPASAIIKEKENGNIEMLLISPVKISEFMIAKVIAMNVIIVLGVIISTIFIIKGLLKIPFQGSFMLFTLLTILYVFTSSGISMFIASVANNMLQVSQITIMLLLPILYLSGSWAPVESMPYVFQKLTYLSPLKYYLEGSFSIILKGLNLNYVYKYFLGTFLLGVPVFAFGAYFLKRRI
jgi:ABC-2 type transport system permease protein